MIWEIQARHGIEIVRALQIAERQWARQIRRHSHGIEALHGEGGGDGWGGGEIAIAEGKGYSIELRIGTQEGRIQGSMYRQGE